ncbi:uncharacterized protein V2V93DRAFT_369410 [Kockiozyma suomiensis]|uniref:uncharacterized protein n=1 Tax=Kockiozyma suomiensis TaxID=1337062 RepID=UPI003342F3BE
MSASPSSTSKQKRSRGPMTVVPVPKSAKPPGELLTAEEKKANHIASEQKRRQAIREGFDRLTEVVPGLTKSQGRSETIVLQKTLAYLKSELAENQRLVEQISSLGCEVPPLLRVVVNNDYVPPDYDDEDEYYEDSL